MSHVGLPDDWIRELPSGRKGEMGEAFAKTHLRAIADERPEDLFPAFESVAPPSLYTQVRHRRHFTYRDVRDDGDVERIPWEADFTIRLHNLYSDTETRITRTVALEVKTGQYAELGHNQKRVMGMLNKNDEYLVLRAKVRFDGDALARIQYSTLVQDADTKAGYRLQPFDI